MSPCLANEKCKITMPSGSLFRSSYQLARRLLGGSRNFLFPKRWRETTLDQFISSQFVSKPLFEHDTVTSLRNSVTSRIESFAKINSSSKFPHTVVVERLSSRRILRVHGPDSVEFLQMILTADVTRLSASESCLYTMLLNKEGRVLFDVLLYRIFEDHYWIEYDAIARIPLQKHLEIFSLKKHVKIEPVDEMSVWVAYQSSSTNIKSRLDTHHIASYLRTKLHGNVVVEDPRVDELGCRIVLQCFVDLRAVLSDFPFKTPSSGDCYVIQRYKLGIGEGIKDHPPQESLPLECNLDYLRGINFDKDYYLGKELVTNIWKTNVVWRRLMPIVLSNRSPSFSAQEYCIPFNCPLINQKGLLMGTLRNNFSIYGLAALRVEAALEADTVMLKGFNIRAEVTRPSWWPDDRGKDGRCGSLLKQENIR